MRRLTSRETARYGAHQWSHTGKAGGSSCLVRLILARTPEQQRMAKKLAAHAMHARHDSREITAPARRRSPASIDYWRDRVAAENPELPADEVNRRAYHRHREHMTRLSLSASIARQKKAAWKREAKEAAMKELRKELEKKASVDAA
ncbi:hypothetical protein [Frankia sp. EI5c]|uniref:hypothetical protein n=1 Tax=Frankia sp. EI5c TaxID=683316 RepID=UPI0018FEB117|nr:hypothetical protein [Frankia sp. EI5c]